jgi:hypothetical protein
LRGGPPPYEAIFARSTGPSREKRAVTSNSILSLSKDGRSSVLLVALIALLLVACNGDDPPAQTADITPTAAPTTEATRQPASSPAPGGVITNNEPVAFMTDDGVTLRGHLYSTPGPKRKVLAVVSALPQMSYQTYVSGLTGSGVALLTFDLRGVGETGGARSDARLAADIQLATLYLKSRDYPQVYLLGIGAPASSAVFTVAATQDLAGVAAVPAGGNTTQEIAQVAEPKLFMAETNDMQSQQNIDRLMAAAPGFKQKLVFSADGAPPTDVLGIRAVQQAVMEFLAR